MVSVVETNEVPLQVVARQAMPLGRRGVQERRGFDESAWARAAGHGLEGVQRLVSQVAGALGGEDADGWRWMMAG